MSGFGPSCSRDRLIDFDAAQQSGRIVGGVFFAEQAVFNRTTQATRSAPRGFTLVELVLVIIIMGVVAAIAMPRFAQATARQQLSAAADRLVSDFEKAQHTARASSNQVAISFDVAGNSYTVTPASGSAYVVQLDESPYQVTIAKASFDGATTMSFNGYGIPSSAGAVVLESSTGSVVVNLASTGRATR